MNLQKAYSKDFILKQEKVLFYESKTKPLTEEKIFYKIIVFHKVFFVVVVVLHPDVPRFNNNSR